MISKKPDLKSDYVSSLLLLLLWKIKGTKGGLSDAKSNEEVEKCYSGKSAARLRCHYCRDRYDLKDNCHKKELPECIIGIISIWVKVKRKILHSIKGN